MKTEQEKQPEKKMVLPGVRLMIKAGKDAINCQEPCANASKCNLAGFAGAAWALDTKTGNAQVVIDEPCKDGKHLLAVDPVVIELMGYKIIFSFHDVHEKLKCESTGCAFQAHYAVYNFLMPAKFFACATHTIEWFNQQYRLIADVVDQQKKQFNLLKYSVPIMPPGDDKA